MQREINIRETQKDNQEWTETTAILDTQHTVMSCICRAVIDIYTSKFQLKQFEFFFRFSSKMQNITSIDFCPCKLSTFSDVDDRWWHWCCIVLLMFCGLQFVLSTIFWKAICGTNWVFLRIMNQNVEWYLNGFNPAILLRLLQTRSFMDFQRRMSCSYYVFRESGWDVIVRKHFPVLSSFMTSHRVCN